MKKEYSIFKNITDGTSTLKNMSIMCIKFTDYKNKQCFRGQTQ